MGLKRMQYLCRPLLAACRTTCRTSLSGLLVCSGLHLQSKVHRSVEADFLIFIFFTYKQTLKKNKAEFKGNL